MLTGIENIKIFSPPRGKKPTFKLFAACVFSRKTVYQFTNQEGEQLIICIYGYICCADVQVMLTGIGDMCACSLINNTVVNNIHIHLLK